MQVDPGGDHSRKLILHFYEGSTHVKVVCPSSIPFIMYASPFGIYPWLLGFNTEVYIYDAMVTVDANDQSDGYWDIPSLGSHLKDQPEI